eukprot:TRINITY_DN5696_c0_g1_i2.p2 TRINITY_DN5696_c0_g1~~TRINITY_DN5696_c0_g1_i2.p2  ORF type:complete len:662 (-),score=132.04 TRINITY_DN5696_c0_g1_i2:68-2053(-)
MYLFTHDGKNVSQYIEQGHSDKDQQIFDQMNQLLLAYENNTEQTIAGEKLLLAVSANDITAVEQILEQGYVNVDERRPNTCTADDGYTPLLLAARDGLANVTSLLLQYGADINAVDYFMKATAGHKCGYCGHSDVCQLLVAHGGLVIDAQGPVNGYTALHDATWHDHIEAVKVLIAGGARQDLLAWDGLSVHGEAEKYWYSDITPLVNDTTMTHGVNFFDLVLMNDLVGVKQLLAEGQDPNEKDNAGMTALHYAAGRGYSQMLEQLLLAGASPFLLDSVMGTSPLHLAAQGGNVGCLQLLLQHGAFIDLNNAFAGHTPLQEAVWYKNPVAARFLLEHGANSEIKNHYCGTVDGFITPSMSVMDQVLNNASAKAIEDHREEVKQVIASQLLNAAVLDNDTNRVHELLTGGYVNINERRPNTGEHYDGYTPLLIAALQGYTDIVVELLQAGADPKVVDYYMKSTVVHKCGYSGNYEVCQIITNWPGAELNAQGPINGYTALHDSIWHGHHDAAAALIKGGVRTDLVAWDNLTPLQEAQKYGFDDIVQLLANATDPTSNIEQDEDTKVRVMNVFGVIPAYTAQMKALVEAYAPAVRQEPGCQQFDFEVPLVNGVADGTTMYLSEVWNSQTALQQHVGLQSTKDFVTQMQQLLVSSQTFYSHLLV